MQAHATTADAGGVTTTEPAGTPSLPPRISWGAVLAGAVVAVAVAAMLYILGLAVGGWVVARLSGTTDGTDAGLHGLSVWAIGFLISAVVLGNAVAGATSAAWRGASSIIGAASEGAGQAAQALAPQMTGAVNPDQLVERLRNTLQGGGDPTTMTADQRRAEITQILGERVRQGSFQPGSRERLSQLVATEFGIPAQEANERIGRIETQATEAARAAEIRARKAAETASDAAATGAYWLFAALVLGAIAAVLGARMGTRRGLRSAYAQAA